MYNYSLYRADIKQLQLEFGNKATDWSPSPEDVENSINNLETQINIGPDSIVSKVEEIGGDADDALTMVTQLADTVSALVVDESGQSMMTQTGDRWTFDISTIQENIGSVADDLDKLGGQVGGLGDDLDNLDKSTTKILTYVNITQTSDGEPCIELGKDSEEAGEDEFKVVITNTQILFKKNDETPAYINNESMYIDTADIEDELRFGNFAWKKRPSGNMGLMWKG
jgi:hypothetical protein